MYISLNISLFTEGGNIFRLIDKAYKRFGDIKGIIRGR